VFLGINDCEVISHLKFSSEDSNVDNMPRLRSQFTQEI
jgi:hypothetical protein